MASLNVAFTKAQQPGVSAPGVGLAEAAEGGGGNQKNPLVAAAAVFCSAMADVSMQMPTK